MSDSNRGDGSKALEGLLSALALLGAIVLAYAIGNALGINSGRDQISAREHYEASKQDALQACGGLESKPLIECVTEAAESAQDQSDSRQDLYAQQDMSKWAFWLLILSVLTFFTTAVGVWFVRLTLDATLKAVEDTERATKAMIKANEISGSIAEAELRPYLYVDRIELTDKRSFDSKELDEDGEPYPGLFQARATIWLRNAGKVPARNITVYKKEYLADRLKGAFSNYNFSKIDLPFCAPGKERRVFGSVTIATHQRDRFDYGTLHYILRLRFTFCNESGAMYEERADHFLTGDDLETFYLITDRRVAEWRDAYKKAAEDGYGDLFG